MKTSDGSSRCIFSITTVNNEPCVYVCVLSCVRLFVTPMDCTPPSFSVYGIFQARISEWVAPSYSRGSSWPRIQTQVSWVARIGRQSLLLVPPGKHIMDPNLFSASVFQVILIKRHWQAPCAKEHLVPEHCKVRVKVAQLGLTVWDPMDYTVHGNLQARILEWVAILFSRGSSQPRDWTQVSHIAGGFFTSWAEAQNIV